MFSFMLTIVLMKGRINFEIIVYVLITKKKYKQTEYNKNETI